MAFGRQLHQAMGTPFRKVKFTLRKFRKEIFFMVRNLAISHHEESTLRNLARRIDEASFPENTEFSSGYMRRYEEEVSLAHQTQLNEGIDSTQTSMNRRWGKRSHLSNAMLARLGPQALSVEGQPCISETLKARIDGVSRVSRSGVGLILQSPTGELIEQVICLNFSTFNNEAEYEVVLTGLDLALVLATTKLEIKSDSQLIVGQIQREYEAKDERMARYLAMVESHLKKLDKWVIR
uniref:RNase H type-1 domain-containing protein n=1 Tax=Vitis vinifera TaxID=29760 RepID=A5C2D7_VITVI|nr:hypothetical protein VITISV_008562 [Vitis vinifera]